MHMSCTQEGAVLCGPNASQRALQANTGGMHAHDATAPLLQQTRACMQHARKHAGAAPAEGLQGSLEAQERWGRLSGLLVRGLPYVGVHLGVIVALPLAGKAKVAQLEQRGLIV